VSVATTFTGTKCAAMSDETMHKHGKSAKFILLKSVFFI